jgi:hypothetical protein
MNSTADYLIIFIKSVISEEEDSFIILQAPDKNGHQIIAGDILSNYFTRY